MYEPHDTDKHKIDDNSSSKFLILLKSSDVIRFDFIACHFCTHNVLESFIKRRKTEKFYLCYTLCSVKSVYELADYTMETPLCALCVFAFNHNFKQFQSIQDSEWHSFQPRFLFIKSIDAIMKQIIYEGSTFFVWILNADTKFKCYLLCIQIVHYKFTSRHLPSYNFPITGHGTKNEERWRDREMVKAREKIDH